MAQVTALASPRRKLLETAAAPCLALLDLVPRKPESHAVLEIHPSPVAGRVQLRVACRFWMAQLEVAGEVEERLSIPRTALAMLARRGPDAEWLVAEELSPHSIAWRTFSLGASVAVASPMGPLLPELPLLSPPWPESEPGSPPAMLSPANLRVALKVVEQLGQTSLEVVTLPQSLVGAVLLISSPEPDGPQGSIQLAAMAPAEEAAKYERPAIPAAA